MRNYFIFITALVLILVGCAQNEIVEDRSKKNAIAFRSLNDKVTRAANDNEDDYEVFIFYYDEDEKTVWIMENQRVDGKDDSYEPIQYWPAEVNNKFRYVFGFAPYDANRSYPNYPINVNYARYEVPENADEDFTSASVAYLPAPFREHIAPLDFKHRLAKISVNAKVSEQMGEHGFSLDLENAAVELNFACRSGVLFLFTSYIDKLPIELDDTPTTYTKALIPTPEFLIFPQPTWVSTVAENIGESKVSFQLKNVKVIKDGEVYWKGNLNKYELTAGSIINTRREGSDENIDYNNWFLQGRHYNIEFSLGGSTISEDGESIFSKINFASSIRDWDDSSTFEGSDL